MSGQGAFFTALFDPDAALPATLRHPVRGNPAAHRFAVYRNNAVFSLKSNLRDGHPLLGELLGAEAFDALADAFVRAHPPKNPLMFAYGDELPAFLAAFAPLEGVPYAADVARLDRAFRRADVAADHQPIAVETVDLSAPEHCVLKLAPSLQPLASDWPLYDLWQFLSNTAQVPQNMATAQEVMVFRTADYRLELVPLPTGGAAWLRSVLAGDDMVSAAANAPQLDQAAMAEILAGLIQGGLITAIAKRRK